MDGRRDGTLEPSEINTVRDSEGGAATRGGRRRLVEWQRTETSGPTSNDGVRGDVFERTNLPTLHDKEVAC